MGSPFFISHVSIQNSMCIGCSIAMTDYQRISPTTHQAFLSVTCAAVPPFVPSVGCLASPQTALHPRGTVHLDPLGDHLECQVGWHLKTGKKYSPWWKKSIKCGMKWDASCWVYMELSWFITLSPWQNMRILLNYRSKVDVARS